MATLKVLHDNVLIRPEDVESKTSGGVMLPDSDKEKSTKGSVEAIGPGAVSGDGKIIPLTVKPGQKVLYRKWAGAEVKHGDVTYCVMRESEIFAIID